MYLESLKLFLGISFLLLTTLLVIGCAPTIPEIPAATEKSIPTESSTPLPTILNDLDTCLAECDRRYSPTNGTRPLNLSYFVPFCKDLCYAEDAAVQQKDPNECDAIIENPRLVSVYAGQKVIINPQGGASFVDVDEDYRQCLIMVGTVLKSISPCDKFVLLESINPKDIYFAEINGNESIFNAKWCTYGIAKQTGDSAFCKYFIPPPEVAALSHSSYFDYQKCLTAAGATLKDYSVCDRLKIIEELEKSAFLPILDKNCRCGIAFELEDEAAYNPLKCS